jgi:hypothetical protein
MVLVEEPEGKGALETPRRRWKYNIETDLHKNRMRAWTGMMWFRIVTVGGLCKSGNQQPVSVKCG